MPRLRKDLEVAIVLPGRNFLMDGNGHSYVLVDGGWFRVDRDHGLERGIPYIPFEKRHAKIAP